MRSALTALTVSVFLLFAGSSVANASQPEDLWQEVDRLQAEVETNEQIAKSQVGKHQNKSAAARYARVIADSTAQLTLLDRLFIEDTSLDTQLEVMTRIGLVKQRMQRVSEVLEILRG